MSGRVGMLKRERSSDSQEEQVKYLEIIRQGEAGSHQVYIVPVYTKKMEGTYVKFRLEIMEKLLKPIAEGVSINACPVLTGRDGENWTLPPDYEEKTEEEKEEYTNEEVQIILFYDFIQASMVHSNRWPRFDMSYREKPSCIGIICYFDV